MFPNTFKNVVGTFLVTWDTLQLLTSKKINNVREDNCAFMEAVKSNI